MLDGRKGKVEKEQRRDHSDSLDALRLARSGIEFQSLGLGWPALENYVKAPNLSSHLETRTKIIVIGGDCVWRSTLLSYFVIPCINIIVFLQKLWWL